MSTGYTFRGFTIPAHMMPALLRWTKHGETPGHFLQAVLRNDLQEAVARGDSENAAALPAYVGWLHNEAPGDCWGSPAKVATWRAKFNRPTDDAGGLHPTMAAALRPFIRGLS